MKSPAHRISAARVGWLLSLAWVLLLAPPAFAKVEALSFDSPAHEATYEHLIRELRCMVCQNQNLADSNAELAADMRKEVYEMVQAGRSADQIKDFMLARYGDFALYRPPVKSTTWALWFGPFTLLAIGLLALWIMVRQRRRDPEQAANLSDAERSRAEALLRGADVTEENSEK